MMRFPPRLKWDLARVRITKKLFGAQRRPLLLHLDLANSPAQNEIPVAASTDSSAPISSRDLQALTRVRESAAPIAWIGGDTPLRYPSIGQIARDIINLNRTVFIETDGTLLRRRIHEFKPAPRLYLVLPLNGLQAVHDTRAQHPGNFRATVESIRTAKLSGFHICVETTIFADIQLTELRELAAFIHKLDIDGWIQTRPPVSAAAQPTEEKLTSARKLIPNPGWRKFSEHVSLRGKMSLKENLLLGAPHAKSACDGFLDLCVAPSGATLPSQENGASAPEGGAKREDEVRNVGNGSPNQDLPTPEESIRAL